MKKPLPILSCLLVLLAVISCQQPSGLVRPLRIEVFTVYTRNQIPPERRDFQELYYSGCVLNVTESNKFLMTDRDISRIDIYTNRQRFHLEISMNRRSARQFLGFTTRNSNSYVAIVVNNTINNVARIQEPVTDGKVLFSIGVNRTREISTLLKRFLVRYARDTETNHPFCVSGI